MPDIDLSSSHSAVVLIVSLLAAAAITFLFYRRTLPPVSAAWRRTLGSLRFLVLFLLFALLGEPLLSFFFTSHVRPSIVVLMDNSRSMTIASETDVRDVFAAAAESEEMSGLQGAAEVHWRTFDNNLHTLTEWSRDALRFDGDRTNLSGVFETIRTEPPAENLQAVVLLTDGNSTSPSNPSYAAEALGVPVFAIGIGDSTERKDVLVSGLLHNSVAYAGTRVPVQVTIQSSGYDGDRAEVTLAMRGTVVDRSTLILGTGTGEYRTTLFMTPDSAGTIRGDVSVSRLSGETTYENNRTIFFTTVLSGKRKVLLLAGSPGQDVSFIRRSLEADSSTTVVTRIERAGGEFIEGELTQALLNEHDAVFLVGYPGPFSSERSLQILTTAEAARKPLFFMFSRLMDNTRLDRIARLLPVTVRSMFPAELQVFMAPREDLRQHPLLRFGQDGAWSSLPPLFQPQGQFTVLPEAQVIATTRLQSQTLADPLLVTRSVAGRRSIALLGYGLWRWKMLSPQGNLADSPFDEFLRNALQWLTTVDDQRQFRISPAQESFSALEPTIFSAEVYDESMQPVNNASIDLTISGEGRSYTVPFSSIDNGQYEGSGDVLPPGEYTYAATANAGGIELGTGRGSFTVGGLQAEFLQTRLNKDLLKNIAFRTGGSYYDAGTISGLANSITSLPGFRTREVRSGVRIELAHSAWVLGLIVFLLTAEWFLRKRLGLL